MTNYKTISEKIKNAKDHNDLYKIEKSLTNLYNNGVFTNTEFSRIDGLIIDKSIKLNQKIELIDHPKKIHDKINEFRKSGKFIKSQLPK